MSVSLVPRWAAWAVVAALALPMVIPRTVVAAADAPAAEMQRLVVLVDARFEGDDAESSAGGTGVVFAVTSDKLYVVTAAHVVRSMGRSASAIELRFGDDENRPRVRARLERYDDKGLDIAVLVVDQPHKTVGLDLDSLPFDRLAVAGSVRRGDPVYMVGRRANQFSVNVKPDRVSMVRDDTLVKFETNFIVPGFSGGPLFNENWQLLGLIVRDNVPEGEASAMPAVIARLREWGLPVDLRLPYRQVAAGSHVSCRLDADGAARCWGALEFDDMQLSDDRLAIEGMRWKSIRVGLRNLCGVDVAGHAWCLGQNPTGQLGDGTTNASPTSAVRVSGGMDFETVAVGGHSCGLTQQGDAWCWGQGDYAQLGNGSNRSSEVPVRVVGGLKFRSISAGLLHTCGVATDGRAYCWGANELAPFSDDAHLVVHEPLAMSGTLRFTTIGAGYTHTCALATDGAVHCWGQNGEGQLGDGTDHDSSAPVRVVGKDLPHFKLLSVAVTGGHNCALASDGAAWCWGFNDYGELGDGTTTSRNRPVPISGRLKFVSISAGRFHTCGVTRDDVIWCWGGLGGLGTAHQDGSTVPVRVPDSR
jgi:alpha-tubulin suppressor-like RCC1 family protein